MSDTKSNLELIATTAQVVSVVAGVVISVLSFNDTRIKEAEARQIEAAKPFYTLRQNLYAEALKEAGILSNPNVHTPADLAKARTRFAELYVAELSMVEDRCVESEMVELTRQIYPELQHLNPAQSATYHLAHAIRDSFTQSWEPKKTDCDLRHLLSPAAPHPSSGSVATSP
ncbi:hypothetical protein [Paraburkholderia dipogonis]|uniref:hypothetical protein n=1 Tax=Paraburkholderia dipogonis TaxID=1211383 RepID=UPI0038B90901